MRWVNRAASALIAVAILAGPPLAATWWVQAHHWRLPAATQLRALIQQPPQAGVLGLMIGTVALSGWLLLVFAILHDAWQTIARRVRRLRRMPLPTAAQVTAGSMAGIASLTMPAVVPHAGGATPAVAVADTDLPGPQVSALQPGVDLPGGWVPYRTAVAVSLLGGAIWLHRRQNYQPQSPRFGRHRDDADLQPLPGTAEAIIAALNGDDPPPALAPGPLLPPDLPAGLLLLHGPGALSAARGLLVTTILSNALAGGPAPVVTLRSPDLEQLFNNHLTEALPDGLSVDDAALEDALRRSGDDIDNRALMLYVSPAPRQGGAGQTADGGAGPATVVVIGADRPAGRRWHVAADGTTTGGDQARRLCLLDVPAATDLLLLVHHNARTARPREPTPTVAETHPAPRAGQLRLLGGCRLQVDGSEVHLRRTAGLQILAYLAVHPDGATTTELIRAIWPGLNPTTITKRLHTTLTDLRRQLHPTLDDVIVRRHERYQLNPDLIDTDLSPLRKAITAAGTAISDRQRQNAARAITGAYHAELAAGFSWPWLHHPREALRRDVIDAYLSLASSAGPAEAVELVRAATAADPYNEALHERAHTILTAAGDHHAAETLRRSFTQRLLSAGLTPTGTDPRHPGQQAADLRL